nr:immunoglobulin heavy chain junction region [Homo sapiens]MBN4408611.1 immunoglobulin heavy chain junction region [Homo sapiens]
AVSANEQPES